MQDLKVQSLSNDTLQYVIQTHNERDGFSYWYCVAGTTALIVAVLFVVIIVKIYYNQYMKALVLIIAICQFDDKTQLLAGVPRNVECLQRLWGDKYKYDVFICNQSSLYATKQDIIDFVDKHKQKLRDKSYKALILHLISHGSESKSESTIMASDLKFLPIDFMKHELSDAAKNEGNPNIIKIIVNHACRGNADYSVGRLLSLSQVDIEDQNTSCWLRICQKRTNVPTTQLVKQKYHYAQRKLPPIYTHINNNNSDDICYVSNFLTISGNVSGRALSDSGKFTDCFCNSFSNNLGKWIKADLNTLLVEIGRNLERLTNKAELPARDGNLRYDQIRFERFKVKEDKKTYSRSSSEPLHPLLVVNAAGF